MNELMNTIAEHLQQQSSTLITLHDLHQSERNMIEQLEEELQLQQYFANID